MASSDKLRQVQEGDPESIEAADWFARLANDRASEADCEAFRAWRAASPTNAQAYDLIASAWDATAAFADEGSILEMRVAALAGSPDHRSWQQFPAVAAGLALMVCGLAAVMIFNWGWIGGASESAGVARMAESRLADQGAVPVASDAATRQDAATDASELVFSSSYSTSVGEMAEFSLPDGSRIALNTASQVRADFSLGKRELVLVRGEAVFTVAKDRSRPFSVAAGRNRVVALGTVFAVRSNGEEAQITLIEGRVRVDRTDPSGSSASAKLVAGEQLRILPDRSFAISKAEIARATSWRDGRLVFNQTPLREVLEEFNRYSNEKHVLRDQKLGDLLVNGTFRIESSEHFAATLEAGFPVQVRPRASGKVFEVYAAQQSNDGPGR